MPEKEPHRSTQRVLDILENIKDHNDEGMSLTELAATLAVPKSSLFPIIHTLCRRNVIAQNPLSAKYTIGYKAYEIGSAYLKKGGISDDIIEEMQAIVHQCSETCHFAELIEGDVFYLFRVDSPESVRMFASPGKKLPAYSTGLGKALLAGKTQEEIIQLYPNGLYAVTERTITDINQLWAQLEEIKKTGFAFECEESTPFIRCIGVPIMRGNKVRAAVSVAVPVFRYNAEKESLIINLLKNARAKIEKLINMPDWTGF
jgi:DNA-binding IclR family transcriptional regulator